MGAATVRRPNQPAAPGWWCVTWPPMSAGGAMMVSPAWQVAMKTYRLLSAPEATRTSAWRAPNTSAASSAFSAGSAM